MKKFSYYENMSSSKNYHNENKYPRLYLLAWYQNFLDDLITNMDIGSDHISQIHWQKNIINTNESTTITVAL